jgi:hypothetical protein
MLLLEDGSIYILKNGHINNVLHLNSKTQIDQECGGSVCRFLISTNSTYEYIECETNVEAETWVNMLRRIRKMVMDVESQNRKSRKTKAKMSRPSEGGRSGRGNDDKTIEAKMTPK